MAAVAMETRISRQNSKCSESNAIWQGGSLACIELDSGQKIFKMATVAMETRFSRQNSKCSVLHEIR